MDYDWVLGKEEEIKPLYHANPSVYQKGRSRYSLPAPLRYDPNLKEIFVKDGVIVGVAYQSSYPKYHFEKLCIVKVEDIVSIYEWFEDKWEDAQAGFFRKYILQPILYMKQQKALSVHQIVP